MAEKKPSAAVRAHPRVRRTATHAGVTHITRHQPDRYTIIGNHLAQHRELSLTAIGVGTHILSLPEGASVDIRTLAARFPEGRDRIAFALRELEAHGYIERVRERVPGGRVITRTYAHNAPGGAQGHGSTQGRTAIGRGQEAKPPSPPAPAPAPAEPRPVRPVAAVPPVPRVSPAPADAPRSEHQDAAVALLAALRRTDDRLTLSARDVRRLAPDAIAWFDNGATNAAVHRALTANLPPEVESPAGLLAHRLRELLPPPLPAGPTASAGPAADARPRPHPLQTCDGCDRAFRAEQPGCCRDCRSQPTAGGTVLVA
ncbi:helix-turn-helix domain-containing protein [Streptomyces sp. NPDC017993]|uniref:helix-turn-helix domain-containing protein n=1 Tax=Streptomyces sp. NPDC017993 TaxID=3365027 RepID=UPI003789264C